MKMNSGKNSNLKLTKNEQEVLKKIILEGRIADTVIASNMKISQQAVNKIRTKLEEAGIISGYAPIINYKKIGINLISLVGLKVKSEVWKTQQKWNVAENLKKIPNVFIVYRITGYEITHAVVMGFSHIDQRDKLIEKIETKYADQVEIKWNYSFSVEHVILNDPTSLLYTILDKKEFSFDEFL